jgi:hypothetical protein
MLQRLPSTSRDVEDWVAIPTGCRVPLAIAAAALVGVGLFVRVRLQAARAPADHHVVVRVFNNGAAGGPQVLSTQIVPLR